MTRTITSVLGACFAAAMVSCSGGDDTKIDYTVRFTDVMNKDRGEAAMPGSFTSLMAQQTVPLQGSMATLEIKSDQAGLRFSVIEPSTPAPMRRGGVLCVPGKGGGVAQANAQLGGGGHYLITVNYKGASCAPDM